MNSGLYRGCPCRPTTMSAALTKTTFAALALAALFLLAMVRAADESSAGRGGAAPRTSVVQGCPVNPDPRYDRRKLLEQFDAILKASVPEYAKYPLVSGGFFVHDLTDPSNSHPSARCINFVDKHVYHFAVVYIPFSQSHFAVLDGGALKVFKSVNCKDSKDRLEDVISYVRARLKGDERQDETITRLKNYRRYGRYKTTDELSVACNADERVPENPDKLYPRGKTLQQLSEVLRGSLPEAERTNHFSFPVEQSRANGFFVYDLTEPTNKQTSLLERVDFKNRHVYHVSYIDLPFSFSHIVILEDGELKVFRSVNCRGKGDSIEEVVGYLSQKLKGDNSKAEIINRVKKYREYGIYAPFDGSSTPRCES